MIANLSKGNVLLLKVDNGLDYATKEQEIKQMKKETAIMNVVENAIEAKNAGFEKATINFTTHNESGEKNYHTYFVNVAGNGNVALNPADKDKDPTIWVNKFENDGKVSYGFQKWKNGNGEYALNKNVAEFLDSVETKEANGKSFVSVSVSLNNKELKEELIKAQEGGQKAYAVIKNNGEIRIAQGNPPKEQQAEKQAPQQEQSIGNPNKQKQNDMER